MKIGGGSVGSGDGTVGGDPQPQTSVSNDGLDGRQVAEVRRERADQALLELDATDGVDDAVMPEASGEDGDAEHDVSALAAALETERAGRLVAELRLRIERAASSMGAVDAEAVSSLVIERASGLEEGAELDTAALVEAIRSEKPTLFGLAGSGGSLAAPAPVQGARGGSLAPAWGLGGAGLSSEPGAGSAAALDSLATSARANSADRRALLRYLRARRSV